MLACGSLHIATSCPLAAAAAGAAGRRTAKGGGALRGYTARALPLAADISLVAALAADERLTRGWTLHEGVRGRGSRRRPANVDVEETAVKHSRSLR